MPEYTLPSRVILSQISDRRILPFGPTPSTTTVLPNLHVPPSASPPEKNCSTIYFPTTNIHHCSSGLQTMSQIPIPTGLQEDSLEHTIEILAKQFNDDAFQRYILLDELQGSEKTDIGVELNQEVFGFVVPDFLKGGARMITIPGSGVASVW